MNIRRIPMINDKIKQREGLIQCHFVTCGFTAANAIDNVGLNAKQLSENGNDNRRFSKPGKSENNAAGLMYHRDGCMELFNDSNLSNETFTPILSSTEYQVHSCGGPLSGVVTNIPGGGSAVCL